MTIEQLAPIASARSRDAQAALLWAVTRPDAAAADVVAALETCPDPAAAGLRAIDHRIGPLLWSALGRCGRREALGAALEPVRLDAATWSARAFYLPTAVRTAISPLLEAGMEPVLFKGPVMAERYPARGLRPMGDLDVLLPRCEHPAALEALGRAGWHLVTPATRLHAESVLVHPDVPVLGLELHAALDTWHERQTRLTAGLVLARRRPAECMGTPVFVLEPVDELLVLATHAAKPFHCFSHLVWTADLALLVERGLDWEAVAARARETGAGTVLAVALSQVERCGVTVPDGLRALPAQRWRRTSLAPLVAADWPLDRAGIRTRRRALFALPESWPARARLLAGEARFEPAWRQPWLLARRGLRSATGLLRLLVQRRAHAS